MGVTIDVPNGTSGNWKVEDFEISKESAKFNNMRARFSDGRFIKAGFFKRLMRGGEVIMSNTPSEINDHYNFIRIAKIYGGNVLINGLGLGVVLKEILTSDKIKTITVIEKSQDVINLVADTYLADTRVTIIHADAFDWKPPKGTRYDTAWHDIWDSIYSGNVPEMTRLHRKYGRRTDWQGSWCKSECQRRR